MRLLRFTEVQNLTGLSRSTLERRVREGGFPRPVTISPGAVAFVETEVRAWIEARVALRDREIDTLPSAADMAV